MAARNRLLYAMRTMCRMLAVLMPEQKTIADQHFGTMGHRGMRFGQRAG